MYNSVYTQSAQIGHNARSPLHVLWIPNDKAVNFHCVLETEAGVRAARQKYKGCAFLPHRHYQNINLAIGCK
jgi:hypothetical protein